MRPGGAGTWSMIKTTTGVDLLHQYVNVLLGFELDQASMQLKCNEPVYRCMSKCFHPARNALIDSIQIDTKQLRCSPNVIEVVVFKTVGERIRFDDAIGWIVVRGRKDATMEQIEASLKQHLAFFKFELTDD